VLLDFAEVDEQICRDPIHENHPIRAIADGLDRITAHGRRSVMEGIDGSEVPMNIREAEAKDLFEG